MLRVATLNHYQPGLARDDLSNVGQPIQDRPNEFYADPWEALRGWGQRLYRKADIVFLTEVRHEPHLRFLSQPDISGLQHYALMQAGYYSDVAILSRFPLFDVSPIRIDRNNLLAAKAMIDDAPHLLIAAHWWIDQLPGVTSATRIAAAQRMLDLIRDANMPTLVGGDLNVWSGDGPEGSSGIAPAEYVMLSRQLWDIYRQFTPRPNYGSGQRIDYLLFKGNYESAEYNASFGAHPSDHPFIIASLKARAGESLRVKSHAPVTAVSQKIDELIVAGISNESLATGRLMCARWASPVWSWSGWHPFPSAFGSPESFVGSAIEDSRAYVLWIGDDGCVYHRWRGADGQWSIGWPVGNSNVPNLNGVPGGAVHAVSCQPGMLHVFYTRPDGRILVARRDTTAGGTWPEHQSLLRGATSPGGHVTAVSRRPGQVDVFCVGTNGEVFTAAWNSQSGWQGWEPIRGLLARPGNYVGAVSRRLDHLDLFVAEVAGLTMSAAWEPQFGWRGWRHIRGGRTGPGGYVTAVSRSVDKLDIFTTGLDWRVYTAAWQAGGDWGGWWPINEARSKTPIWPVSRSADKLDIFFVALDGTVQTAAWEPGRTWGGPWAVGEAWAEPE